MSAELDEDISVLNIDELDYGDDEDGDEDFTLPVNHCRTAGDARSKELNVFDLFRHRISGVKANRNISPTMNRKEDVMKELQSLRDSNRALQQECTAVKESRLSSQNECLQLRDKVSSLFRENCSLKEQSAKLNIDNRSLQKQVDSLKQNNTRLRDRLQQFSQQLKCFMRNNEGSSESSALLRHEEEVKRMLDVLGNIPKYGEESKGDSSSLYEKKELQRVPSEKLQGSPVFSLELDHENLEQISNKLLEHLQQEKKELEQQYTQMVEVQKQSGVYTMTESLQSCLNSSNVKEKEVLGLLESCRSTSKLLKQEVLIQNKLLSTMIRQTNLVKTLQKKMPELQIGIMPSGEMTSESTVGNKNAETNCTTGNKMQDLPLNSVQCTSTKSTSCTPKAMSNLDTLLQTYGIRDWETSDTGINSCREPPECAQLMSEEDRICPMCQAVFPKAFPLPEFEAHVMEHFRSEEFEIITQDVDYG